MPHGGNAAITLLVARAAASSLLTTPISDWSAERLVATWSSVDDIGAPVSTDTCQARARARRPHVPATPCLLSPDADHVTAEGVLDGPREARRSQRPR